MKQKVREKPVAPLLLLAKNLSYVIFVKCPKCGVIGEVVKSRVVKTKPFKGIKCWLGGYKFKFTKRDVQVIQETLDEIDDMFNILIMKLTERGQNGIKVQDRKL